ncbi:uncharacterized protein LOC132724209 [Ruditapes philippinarum]|uniref:uncharacterized protein LOC132724209 n=1 Tax=Ruditapes philippinarum TaxID=129788 RepID=UPI00295B7A01|nr:uncharacterized protein LOC132724209 [Ruditapes philippinarum]
MMFHRLLLPFLLWVGISYAANEALIPLDHICDSGYCNFEFKVEGTYYFRNKNDVSRMEIQRFPNSFLDTSNMQLLQSVFIQYTEDLPEEPCRIFVNLNACIDLYIGSSNEPVHCCKQSETKRATSASETSATKVG